MIYHDFLVYIKKKMLKKYIYFFIIGVIKKRGVLAPYTSEINGHIIAELEKEGIKVKEEKL